MEKPQVDIFPYTSVFLVSVTCAIIYSYFRFKNQRFNQLAAKIPGPTPLPIFGNALDFVNEDNTSLPAKMLTLMEEYNGTARIWLGQQLMIFISKPNDIEACLNNSKLIEKNEVYSLFDDMLGQGLLNSSGDIWKKHRRIITPAFHISILKHFIEIFDRNSQILVKRFESTANQEFDVFPYLRDCALNFITETALETNIDALSESVSASTRATEKMMQITADRLFKIWLHPNQIFNLTKQGHEYKQLRQIVQDTTMPLLQQKKKEIADEEREKKNGVTYGIERKSFFRSLVSLNENGENFNDKEVRDEVMTIIVTGYETTAATVAFALVMLGIHQDVQQRVRDEVLALSDKLAGRRPDYDDLQTLTYMDMVIKETLRLYPVGAVILRKASAEVSLPSCTVPQGASVAVVFLHTHRDPSIWESPLKFDPENFLPENVAKRHPYSYSPFSAGPRGCIGQKYAQISMRVMLYNILSTLAINCDRRFEDVNIKLELTLKMVDGFRIRINPLK